MANDIGARGSRRVSGGSAAGGAYGLGFLGAVIYYIAHAATFGAGVLGFLKAIVWPVFVVYKLMEFLKL